MKGPQVKMEVDVGNGGCAIGLAAGTPAKFVGAVGAAIFVGDAILPVALFGAGAPVGALVGALVGAVIVVALAAVVVVAVVAILVDGVLVDGLFVVTHCGRVNSAAAGDMRMGRRRKEKGE